MAEVGGVDANDLRDARDQSKFIYSGHAVSRLAGDLNIYSIYGCKSPGNGFSPDLQAIFSDIRGDCGGNFRPMVRKTTDFFEVFPKANRQTRQCRPPRVHEALPETPAPRVTGC